MANIQAFTTALQGGGARANQFQVTMAGGGATGIQSRGFSFLCRGAQIPAMTIGEVAVPYRGRQIFLAGDRTYDAWPTTIDAIDLAFDTNDQLEEFGCTFRFNYMTATGTGLTNPGARATKGFMGDGVNVGDHVTT